MTSSFKAKDSRNITLSQSQGSNLHQENHVSESIKKAKKIYEASPRINSKLKNHHTQSTTTRLQQASVAEQNSKP